MDGWINGNKQKNFKCIHISHTKMMMLPSLPTLASHHLQEYESLEGKNPRSVLPITVFKLLNYTREIPCHTR